MPSAQVTYTLVVHPDVLKSLDLKDLMDSIKDFGPVLQDMGRIMGAAQVKNFLEQGAEFGENWAPLKASTIAEKKRKGFSAQPLVRTGALAQALGQEISITPSSVTTGIDLSGFDPPYPAYQDSGSKGGRLPARILMGFSASEVQAMREALTQYLLARGWTVNAFDIKASVRTASGSTMAAV